MKQKLIALDLDGTTLNNQSLLSDRTKNVLARLQKDNHLVMIATGRPYRNSKEFYETLKLTTPLVNFNGALCHNPTDSNWSNYYHKTLNKDFALDLIEQREEMGIDFICIEGKNKLFASTATLPSNEYFQKNLLATQITSKDTLTENPTSMNVFSDERNLEAIRDRILARYGNSIEIRTWGGTMPCLEIVTAGVQKALGVEVVANNYGIKREDILAFGDEDNDMEMIRYAGHGVVMQNGITALKKIADDVTTHTNHDDGLAIYLEKYFCL